MEKLKTLEQKPEFSSKIALRFFRHDEKEGDPLKNDHDIELSDTGREHAKTQARETNLSQSVAFGSPRLRTQETAGFVMAGDRDEITGKESFAELKAKIDSELGHGSKIKVDQRLNFALEADTGYVRKAEEAYKNGELVKFLVEESDELAKNVGDNESSTYSRMASSVASIIKKYFGIAPRWDDLANDESKQYEKTLERFFGTHQSIQESFLAKVIELTKGIEERDRFVRAIGNKGFNYTEGFEVDITKKNTSAEPTIHLTYKKEGSTPTENFVFDEEVSGSVLDQIVIGKN